MSPELIAIIATAISLLGLILNLQRTLHKDITGLRERMVRLEGLFEGFIHRAGPHSGFPAVEGMNRP